MATQAYKLMRQRKDGSLGPLFINKRQRIPTGRWLEAQCHPTKGFAVRPGWHVTLKPVAPHLRQGGDRVWVKIEVEDATEVQRPESQGGSWLIANRMRVVGLMDGDTDGHYHDRL